MVDLTGRMAHCSQGCTPRPSSPDLAFFEFQGEGSQWATEKCGECGYYLVAHTPEIMARPHMKRIPTHDFVPAGPRDHDTYYCGCRGWD